MQVLFIENDLISKNELLLSPKKKFAYKIINVISFFHKVYIHKQQQRLLYEPRINYFLLHPPES